MIDNKIVFINVIWKYLERFSVQIISFIVSLVLSRLLSPNEYGTIALVYIVINLFDVFSTRGFNQALIKKKNADIKDYCTVFFSNIIIETFLFIVIFFTSPYIARFFKDPQLCPILRVSAISLLINAFNSVQRAYVEKNMLFKKFFFSTLGGTLLSGILGVIFALKGFGVWSLVVQLLSNNIVDTIILFFTIELKPHFIFSTKSLKSLSSYGLKIYFAGLTEAVFNQIRSFIIGKFYTSADLAYYNKGQSLPLLLISSMQMSAGDVFFSALCHESDIDRIKEKARELYRIMFYIQCPLLLGVSLISKPLINVLFSHIWEPSYYYVIIFSLIYLLWIPEMIFNQAINAAGFAGKNLFLIIGKKIIDMLFLLLFFKKGVVQIAFANLISDFIIFIFSYILANHLLKYKLSQFIKDTVPTLFVSLFSICPCFLFTLFIKNYVLIIFIQIFISVILFICFSKLFNLSTFNSIIAFIKSKTIKGKNKNEER